MSPTRAQAHRPGPGELDRHLDFQRREWRVQRAGWYALAVFVLLALLGLFGNGPLSTAAAADARGEVRVEYERFIRSGASQRLVLTLTPPAGAATAEVRMSRSYFDAFRLEHVLPEPLAIESGPEWTSFRFRAATSAQVILAGQVTSAGPHTATFATPSGGSVRLWQLAYF